MTRLINYNTIQGQSSKHGASDLVQHSFALGQHDLFILVQSILILQTITALSGSLSMVWSFHVCILSDTEFQHLHVKSKCKNHCEKENKVIWCILASTGQTFRRWKTVVKYIRFPVGLTTALFSWKHRDLLSCHIQSSRPTHFGPTDYTSLTDPFLLGGP